MWSWKLNSFYLQPHPHLRGHEGCVLWGRESFQSISEFCFPQKDTGQFRQRYAHKGDQSFHISGYVFCRRKDERRDEDYALHDCPGCSLTCHTTPALVVSNSVTPWTVAHQAPLSMGFSRQEYWGLCHGLLQGIFPTQGSNPPLLSPALAGGFFTPNAPPVKPVTLHCPPRAFVFSTCCFVASWWPYGRDELSSKFHEELSGTVSKKSQLSQFT